MPPGWAVFDFYAKRNDAGLFGFTGSVGDVNRFAARYRLAKSFRGLHLDGYSETTADGYAALARVTFTWSAFERLLELLGLRQKKCGALIQKYDAGALIAELRALDIGDKFYRFVREKVEPPHRPELDNYLNLDPCNVTYLASTIRHVFAHGILTPGANKSEAANAAKICNRLSQGLFRVMDREFEEHIRAFQKQIEPPEF